MIKGKLIVMQKDLGLGHRGDILITTQERVDKNLPALAKEILDEETAFEFKRRWNAFEEGGSHTELLAACKTIQKARDDYQQHGQEPDKDMLDTTLDAAIAAAETVEGDKT